MRLVILAAMGVALACGDSPDGSEMAAASSQAGVGPSPGSGGAAPGAPSGGAGGTSEPTAGTTAPAGGAAGTSSQQPSSGGAGAQGGTTAMPPGGGPGAGSDAGATDPSSQADASVPVSTSPSPGADQAADAEPSEGCGATSYPESGEKTIDVDGVSREYVVELPQDYDPQRPYRLVFAWHGLGGTAAMTARSWYGLPAHADSSAIFIAGQAGMGSGQQSGFASWYNAGQSNTPYVRAMLDWAKTSYCVDVSRVFSIGMSNGGMMSNIVGCELGDSFRALAAMSGGGPQGYSMAPCTGQVAVWISHGNQDNNVPFSYGESSRDYWTMANGCNADTVASEPAECLAYQGCDEGFPVEFCEFDGGHMVPSFTGEAAWRFFSQF